jgi:TM2 domain-containing membrane protein YozV
MSTMPYPTPQQVFQMQFESVRRDEFVGVMLALFLGCFGIHHFYLNRVGLGILYCCFCWTGIPAILGVIECFFMPGRVRIYNAVQAAGIAAGLGIVLPGYMGYPTWGGPDPAGLVWTGSDHSYPQSMAVSGLTYPDRLNSATPLITCANCHQTNLPAARFCSGCGLRLN